MATVGLEHQQLLIGGRWQDAGSGKTHEKTNPFTGDSAGSAAAAGREDAKAAVEAAQQAFPAWSQTPPQQRADILRKAADTLMQRQEEIAGIVTDETGATFGWGMFNVELGAGMFAFNAEQADALTE